MINFRAILECIPWSYCHYSKSAQIDSFMKKFINERHLSKVVGAKITVWHVHIIETETCATLMHACSFKSGIKTKLTHFWQQISMAFLFPIIASLISYRIPSVMLIRVLILPNIFLNGTLNSFPRHIFKTRIKSLDEVCFIQSRFSIVYVAGCAVLW